ncbi:hypothetical protein PsorP6_013929 [Peronosclerospora sorghi]|uniref:Uncharacterized protein n=1 Tax=Peronosclerospora sorghi TaxID=230839 RepID=A0ACC0VJD5_9STRA|nr:hypothetical protein PsorP6_013929 [Peronosclerospora sorghi]
MNRLLQHFVDTNGTTSSRPAIPTPPHSSGGSYHGGSRGSFQRETPGGPFHYQPGHPQAPWQPRPHAAADGLEEIPLTSHSNGSMYETVDLNADKRQVESSPRVQPQPTRCGSTSSAAELFAGNASPAPSDCWRGSSSPSTEENPFQIPSKSVHGNSFVANGYDQVNETNTLLFQASGEEGGCYGSSQESVQGRTKAATSDKNASTRRNACATQHQDNSSSTQTIAQENWFAPLHMEDNRNVVGNQTLPSAAQDTILATSLNESVPLPYDHSKHEQEDTSVSASSLEKSAFSHSRVSRNEEQEPLASADVLFGSPASTTNGDWTHSVPSSSVVPLQLEPRSFQAQESRVNRTPSASSLFSGEAPTMFKMSESTVLNSKRTEFPLPPKPLIGVPPSPAKPEPRDSLPASKQSVETTFMTLQKPQIAVAVPLEARPEHALSPAIDAMKISPPAKPSLKIGIDARAMKCPVVKREDDTVSNAPSRLSMLSTLDDSLKLSDMYKQMSARLEGEKHDLLKVVASQAQEIAQLKKHIKSLELQLQQRPQDQATWKR